MDKNEYRAKLEEINDLVDRQDYKGALEIVETIDWRRVRSARTLCMVGEIYEANKRYPESRKLLLMAHHRAPIGRTVLYRLVELSIKMGNLDEADEYYKEFIELSPKDNSRYILQYKLARGKGAPLEEQIAILKEYKSQEYTERWSYVLARLYAQAGMKEACIEECDDLILWFSEGKYVTKAMELKMKFTPLTPIQQEKYDHRFEKGYVPKTAVKAVDAASQAAEKAVHGETSPVKDQEEEIDEIIKHVMEQGTGNQPQISDTQEIKDKAAQDIMDVLPGRNGAEEETAATREPFEKKEYVVKDLEPENIGGMSDVKPFHVENSMKASVQAQAPKSQPIKEEDMNPEDFKTDSKEKELELDLEALLAETASELAQAVSEETGDSVSFASEPEKPDEEPAQEEESPEDDAITSALMEKAMEFEQDDTREQESEEEESEEIVTEEIIDTQDGEPVVEAVEEAVFEESPFEEGKDSEETPETEPFQEEEPSAETESFQEEEPAVENQEAQEEEDSETEESQEESFSETEEAQEELGETKVIPEVQDTLHEEEEEYQPSPDTGAFSTAAAGLMRHHLTEEEHRRLFTYFAPVPGMSQQINEALDTAQESACSKTSRAGNIVVTGREGTGKTKLSEGMIKALCKERQMQGARVAYLEAEELNKKDPVAIVDKLSGGFLVVEHAGDMDEEVVENLSKAMEFKTNRLTVILEDLKPGIWELEEKYPEFMKKFDSRIVIPVFTNDELVSFAKTYAKELGYKIDDMAVLALYTLIGDNQNEENPVSVGMVKEMMDDALKRAAKKGRRPGKRVGKRHLDASGRIMLYEKDFDI